jgi:hypothetical protein
MLPLCLDLSILRKKNLTLYYIRPRVLFKVQPLIPTLVLPITNIVEDMAKAPCAMSSLKVLQNCPSQGRTLLEAIGVLDPESSNTITFNMDDYKMRLSHQLVFQIEVIVHIQLIHHTILDEGALTCVISLSRWKGIKSPGINQSPTMLKSFDG